jgi:hypothetical protein
MGLLTDLLFGRDPVSPAPDGRNGAATGDPAQATLDRIGLDRIGAARTRLDNERRVLGDSLAARQLERERLIERYADARLKAARHEMQAIEREFERIEAGIRSADRRHHDLLTLLTLLDRVHDLKIGAASGIDRVLGDTVGLDSAQLREMLDGVLARQDAQRRDVEDLNEALAAADRRDALARDGAAAAARERLMQLTDDEVQRAAAARAGALAQAAARVDVARPQPLSDPEDA